MTGPLGLRQRARCPGGCGTLSHGAVPATAAPGRLSAGVPCSPTDSPGRAPAARNLSPPCIQSPGRLVVAPVPG